MIRKFRLHTCINRILFISVQCCVVFNVLAQDISGELKLWHPIALTFTGPETNETADPNPFSDYRLTVIFEHDTSTYTVPGYFAADGNAANSTALSGNKWRVHFTPDRTGHWRYQVQFRTGPDIALSDDAGIAMAPDGIEGVFEIGKTDKVAPDFRAKGRLAYVGEHYLKHLGSQEYFIKTGADAPETFLAYQHFDQTHVMQGGAPLKLWQPHMQDWQEGDPVWRDSLGKGIIGAINYLSSEEQNAISFLTMNIDGDGRNVWPFADSTTFDRFDCSKLDQWEIIFTHCDQKGLFLHFKTQEEENDQLLDGGSLGRTRKLYYRELVARFGHHLALNWNLGEENTNTDAQRKAFAQYFTDLDPYHHPIVVHTFPGGDDGVFTTLLGSQSTLAGASLQSDWQDVHDLTLEWVQKSKSANQPWVICNDEQGPAFTGVPNDGFKGSPTQDDIRRSVLWGNLMAGGAGVEYFFGYALPHNDLTCEDYRSRDKMWDYNRIASRFFLEYLPFWNMVSADSLIIQSNESIYCMTDPNGVLFVVFLPFGGELQLDLSNDSGVFVIEWFDPRNGGTLQQVSRANIPAGAVQSLGIPPSEIDQDWVVLLRKSNTGDPLPTIGCAPFACDTSILWWNNVGSVMSEQIIVEHSTNGILFAPFDAQPEIRWIDQCHVKVPLDPGESTFFRLQIGSSGVLSRIVNCTRTCENAVGGIMNGVESPGKSGKGND
jgi:hypothetical protein